MWQVFPPGAAHMSRIRSPGRGLSTCPTTTEGRFCTTWIHFGFFKELPLSGGVNLFTDPSVVLTWLDGKCSDKYLQECQAGEDPVKGRALVKWLYHPNTYSSKTDSDIRKNNWGYLELLYIMKGFLFTNSSFLRFWWPRRSTHFMLNLHRRPQITALFMSD